MAGVLDNDRESTAAPLIAHAMKTWMKRLNDTTVGPELAVVLAERPGLGPVDTDAATTEANKHRGCRPLRSQAVVESLIARQRLIAHLSAEQHLDLTELSRSYPGIHEFLPTEVGVALGISDMAASGRLHRAHELVHELPGTFEAMHRGVLASDKAELIRRLTADVPAPLRERVERDVLSRAAGQSMLQLEYAVRRAVLHHDPVGAEDRRIKATRARQIRITRLPNEMASLYLVSDAADMAVVKTCLDEHARLAATPEDTRTADARRVDVLVDLCAEALHTLNNPQDRPADGGAAAADGGERGVPADPADHHTAPATNPDPEPTEDEQGTTAPDGRADHAADTAPARTPDHTEPAESVPAASTPANTVPAENPTGPATDSPVTDGPNGTTASANDPAAGAETTATGSAGQQSNTAQPANPLPATGAAHATTTSDGPAAGDTLRRARRHRGTARISLIVPHDVLLGLHSVCDLTGYGPIGATHALRLLAPDAEYHRLVTEPLTGKLLDYGRTRYIPPDWLKQFVKHRDQTCRAPGCHQPATRCDIDHVTPYSKGGKTNAADLLDLCRHHHRAKDGGEHTVTVNPYGDAFWTTPLGHQAVTTPANLTPEPPSRIPIDGGPARPDRPPANRDLPPDPPF